MKFTLSVDSENDALTGEFANHELANIVHTLSVKLADMPAGRSDSGIVKDVNGGTVGTWSLVSSPEDSDADEES